MVLCEAGLGFYASFNIQEMRSLDIPWSLGFKLHRPFLKKSVDHWPHHSLWPLITSGLLGSHNLLLVRPSVGGLTSYTHAC